MEPVAWRRILTQGCKGAKRMTHNPNLLRGPAEVLAKLSRLLYSGSRDRFQTAFGSGKPGQVRSMGKPVL